MANKPNFYLKITQIAASDSDANNATTKPYSGIAITAIVSKFGSKLLEQEAKYLNSGEYFDNVAVPENKIIEELTSNRGLFASPDFETDPNRIDAGVALETNYQSNTGMQQIVTVTWDIYVDKLREFLINIGALIPSKDEGEEQIDPVTGLPPDASIQEILTHGLMTSYQNMLDHEDQTSDQNASDDPGIEPGMSWAGRTLPQEIEPQHATDPASIESEIGFLEATHYVSYKRGVSLNNAPKYKKGSRLTKLPKGAAIYLIDSGLGRKGTWSYVKVLDSSEENNFKDDQVGQPTPESNKKGTRSVPQAVLDSRGYVGYVVTKKISQFQRAKLPELPIVSKQIGDEKELNKKQKGIAKESQMADWAEKEPCEILLVRDSENPWNSEYQITWSISRSFIQKVGETQEVSEEDQDRFIQIVDEARSLAVDFVLKYYAKFTEIQDEEKLKTSERFCRLKKWTIDATTKQGRLLCLFTIPARYLDAIPALDPTMRRATLQEEAKWGRKMVPLMLQTYTTAVPDSIPSDFDVPYQKTVQWADLKLAVRDLKKIFKWYHGEEDAATEVAIDPSRRIPGKIVLYEEEESKPGEYQRIEKFFDNLKKLMTSASVQWPAPDSTNDNNTATAAQCGNAASKSTPDQPHDEAILHFGINRDFSIRYINYNGKPLRVGFDCYMNPLNLKSNRWRLARTLNYLFYSEHIINSKTTPPWTDWFKMYTFPVCSIVPQEEDNEEAELEKEEKRSSDNPAKTSSEVDRESNSINDPEKRKAREKKARQTSTNIQDSALVNIAKAKETINEIKDAYQFLFNKVGIDKLILAIMRCIYLKNVTFEELLVQLGLTAFIESCKDDNGKMAQLLELLSELPIECLVNVLADVAVFKIPTVPPGSPPGGAMTDEEAAAFLAEMDAEADLEAQANAAAADATAAQAAASEEFRKNQIKLHLEHMPPQTSGSVGQGADVKKWHEVLVGLNIEQGTADAPDAYPVAYTEDWSNQKPQGLSKSPKQEYDSDTFGHTSAHYTYSLLQKTGDLNEELNKVETGFPGQAAAKFVHYVTVGQWEKFTGQYGGQPADPNEPLLWLKSPMMKDNKKGLANQVSVWQTYLNAAYEEKFKTQYEAEKFKPSWKGSKKWLLKVDGVFGPRTCKATVLALERSPDDACTVTVGDFAKAEAYHKCFLQPDVDENSVSGSTGSNMNPVGDAQPEGFDCPAGPESAEVKSCGEIYTLMRSSLLDGLRAARAGEDTTEIDKRSTELKNQYYACMVSGEGRIAIGPDKTETSTGDEDATDEEVRQQIAENQVVAEGKCDEKKEALYKTLRAPDDPPDSEPRWPGDDCATDIQKAAMADYQQCLSTETSAKRAEIEAEQSAAQQPVPDGGTSPAPPHYSFYPIPRNFQELADFIKKFGGQSNLSVQEKAARVASMLQHIEFKYPERAYPAIMKHCKEILQTIVRWIEDKLPPEVVELIGKMLELLGPTINVLLTMDLPPKSVSEVVDQFMDDPEKGLQEQVKEALKKIILEILVELVASLTAALEEACKLPDAQDSDEPVRAGNAFRPPDLNDPDLANALNDLNKLLDSLDYPGPREGSPPNRRNSCPPITDLLDSLGNILSPEQMCDLLYGNPNNKLLDQIADYLEGLYPSCDTSSIIGSRDDMKYFFSEVGSILRKSESKYFNYCFDASLEKPFKSSPKKILFDPTKCYDTTIYKKKLGAYIDIGDAFGLSEDDVKNAIDEEVADALEDLAKLAALATDPTAAISGNGPLDIPNPCAVDPELIKGLQSVKFALNQTIDTTFDTVKQVFANDLQFVTQVFLDDGESEKERKERDKLLELTKEDIQMLYQTESDSVKSEKHWFDLAGMPAPPIEIERTGLLQEGYKTKETQKEFVKRLSKIQSIRGQALKKSKREQEMARKLEGTYEDGEFVAKNIDADVEEDSLIIARSYYDSVTETAGSIFYNPVVEAVDIDISDESRLRYSLPDYPSLMDSFIIDVKRELANFAFTSTKRVPAYLKNYIDDTLQPPSKFPTGENSPQSEVFSQMVNKVMRSAFTSPGDQIIEKEGYDEAINSLFWLIQTYSIRKSMMFVTESNLFEKAEMQDLNLYPPAWTKSDDCNIPYSKSGQDFKDLCLLNLEEIKDRIIRKYDEEVEACQMVNPNNEMNPLNEIVAEGILLALLRTYILENILHVMFHLRMFKFEELVSDKFAMDFIFEEMKTGLRKQRIYSVVKDFAKKVVAKRRKAGERINAYNGRECLEFLYGENYHPIAENLNSIIESKREKIFSFVLKRMVFPRPIDAIDAYAVQHVNHVHGLSPGGDFDPSKHALSLIYPVFIPESDMSDTYMAAVAQQATDAIFDFAKNPTSPPQSPSNFLVEQITKLEENMIIKKIKAGNFTPRLSTLTPQIGVSGQKASKYDHPVLLEQPTEPSIQRYLQSVGMVTSKDPGFGGMPNNHGLRFMKPLESFDGVPPHIIQKMREDKSSEYQKFLKDANSQKVENSDEFGMLNLPSSYYNSLGDLGVSFGNQDPPADLTPSEMADFMTYNGTSDLSPLGTTKYYREQYFNIDKKRNSGEFKGFTPGEVKLYDVFAGGGFVLEKYIRLELKDGVRLPKELGGFDSKGNSDPAEQMPEKMFRSFASTLGYSNINRFERTIKNLAGDYQVLANGQPITQLERQVSLSYTNLDPHLHNDYSEFDGNNLPTIGDLYLRHFFKPIKVGLRLLYVLQENDTKNSEMLEKIESFINENMVSQLNTTNEEIPYKAKKSFRTVETVVRNIAIDSTNAGGTQVALDAKPITQMVTYHLPICEYEEELYVEDPEATIQKGKTQFRANFYHMTMKDLYASVSTAYPGSVSDDDKCDNLNRSIDALVPHLKANLMETKSFKAFFEYIIPTRRHMAFSMVHGIVWQKENMNTELFLSATKSLLKKHFLAALNVDQNRYYEDEDSKIIGGPTMEAIMNMRADSASSIPSENPMWPIILKFLLMTPQMILKGLVEMTDPNIKISKKVYDGIVLGQEIIKATVDPDWNVYRPPFVLISLGMLPSSLPYGVGFPPPPIGPGVGPPLTPLGAVYLALGLHELPGFPSSSKKKPPKQDAPPKNQMSEKCEKRLTEIEASDDNQEAHPHRKVEDDTDSSSKKITSSFD